MDAALSITRQGELNKSDAYHACETSPELVRTFDEKQGIMDVRVFVFNDGSRVEFATSGYWYWPHSE